MGTVVSGLLAELPSNQLKICFRRFFSPGSHGAPNHLLSPDLPYEVTLPTSAAPAVTTLWEGQTNTNIWSF